jgi:hypothetical protein
MTSPTDHAPRLPNRRAALIALASSVAAAACGGGGGSSATPTPPPPGPQAARLTLSGPSMLTPAGSAITLRGMNEGTWGEMRNDDAATIAAQGGNVVRVLIRWWGLYGSTDVESRADASPGHFDPAHLSRFLTEIQWCIDAGLWVVPAFDSNCGQNGLQNPDMVAYCDTTGSYPGGHNFWTDLSQRQLFKEAWVYLAGILKDMPNIAFYELLPEPLEGRDSSYGDDVSAFYQELMAAIDAVDTRTPFLVGARDAYNINLCDEAYIADPRWANRVVYTGNLFIHPNKTQDENIATIESRLGALSTMMTARNVPVFIQQYGVRSADDPNQFYLDAGLSRMNAAGVGYTGWQWRQNTTSPDEYAIVLEDPNTGADVVKTDVLAVYSKYWKA